MGRVVLPLQSSGGPFAFPGRRPGFDPSHFAAKGCRLAAIGYGPGAINLVTGKAGVKNSATSQPTPLIDSILGPCSKFLGVSGQGISFAGTSAAASDLTQTYAVIVRPTTLGSTNEFYMTNGGTNTQTGLANLGSSSQGLSIGNFASPFGNTSSGLSLIVGVPYFIVASGTLQTGGVVNFLTLRLDTGAVQTASVTSGTAGPPGTANGTIYFGGAIAAQGVIDASGALACGMYSKQAMSLAQMKLWALDPWAFWYPRTVDFAELLSPTAGGPATQTLLPSLYTNPQSFFGPTVTRGARTLSPSLFTNPVSIFAPRISEVLKPSLYTNPVTIFAPSIHASIQLRPSLYTNPQSFFSPTIVRGAVHLLPSLYTNVQTFFGPHITGHYSIVAPLVTNSQSFFGPTIVRGVVHLLPSLYTNPQSFFGPNVHSGLLIQPPLLTNSQTFFAPHVTQTGKLLPPLVANVQVFFAPTVTRGTVTLHPSLYTNPQVFFAPAVVRGSKSLLPSLVVNSQTIFVPSVSRGGASRKAIYLSFFGGP